MAHVAKSPVTPNPAIHIGSPSAVKAEANALVHQFQTIFAELPQFILDQVIAFIKKETGIDLTGLEEFVLDPIEHDIDLFENAFAGINLANTGAVLNAISSAIDNFAATIVQRIIDAVVNALNVTNTVGNDIASIGLSFLDPIHWIQNTEHIIGQLGADLSGAIASLEGRVHAIEGNVNILAASGGVTLNGGYDNCSTADGFTLVDGGAFGVKHNAIQQPHYAAGYHTQGPTTDKHGIKFRVSNKEAGVVRGWICGDDAMTNYVGIEILTSGTGVDYVRLVTGVGPNEVVPQLQVDGHVGDRWVYEIKYGDTIANGGDNTFYVYRNGDAVEELTWTDTDNLITHGSTKLRVGITSNCRSHAYPFEGFAVTDFTYYDWS